MAVRCVEVDSIVYLRIFTKTQVLSILLLYHDHDIGFHPLLCLYWLQGEPILSSQASNFKQ